MTLMRFDPFRELDRLNERALTGAMRAMPTEAFRRGDEFFVLLDIPGIDPNDVKVTVERNVVNVEAVFTSPRQEGDELIIDERVHGRAARQFFLGENLDPANLRADYDHGVLTLAVPVAEQSKPRQVQVSSAPRTIDVDSPSQGSTQQGSSQQGSSQPGSTQQGSTQQGSSQQKAEQPVNA